MRPPNRGSCCETPEVPTAAEVTAAPAVSVFVLGIVVVPINPTQAQQPPVPGTQVQLPPTTTTYVEPSSSSRSPWSAIFGVLLVLIVIVVIVVIVANNDSSDDSPTPGTDLTPAAEPAPATDPPAEDG